MKLSKAQIKKLIQSGGFFGKVLSRLTGPLMKVAMALAKNVLAPLCIACLLLMEVFKRKYMGLELN